MMTIESEHLTINLERTSGRFQEIKPGSSPLNSCTLRPVTHDAPTLLAHVPAQKVVGKRGCEVHYLGLIFPVAKNRNAMDI